jgi:hypothetical protein
MPTPPHYSTFIEGKRLTKAQAKAAIADATLQIASRKRDTSEVRNY